MIIKPNYLYKNEVTKEFALGGVDVLLTGQESTVQMEFMFRNGGKIVGKFVSVLPEEWDVTPQEPIY